MPVLSNPVLPGNSLNGSLGNMITQAVSSSALGSVGLNKASGRMTVAQMYNYSYQNGPPSVKFPAANQDWRVRVSLAPGATYFYNDPSNYLLSPLVNLPGGLGGAPNSTAALLNSAFGLTTTPRIGVVFPYTPQLTVQHTASYSEQKLTHNNYTNYFYDSSAVSAITINADFTVQSIDEGQYLLATIYFFRAVTKMFFGADPQAGNPPPLVYLNGYGQYYLPNVPCVVTSFSHTMPGDVDYMDVVEPYSTQTGGYNPQLVKPVLNSTRLPTTSTVSLTLQPIYSRAAQSTGFSLNDFASGALVNPQNSGNPATAFGSTIPKPTYATFKPQGGFL